MQQTPRIACVDDDASVREAIVSFLNAHGFAADAFESAEAFLAATTVAQTWCLITDVQLGGISGLQLQSRLKDAGRDIPTIFITAFPNEAIRERAMGQGAVGFLNKPATRDALLACIERAQQRSSEV